MICEPYIRDNFIIGNSIMYPIMNYKLCDRFYEFHRLPGDVHNFSHGELDSNSFSFFQCSSGNPSLENFQHSIFPDR